ncbi:hypothetical protein [Fimbriimonas ginsengisoli]|uniref:Uncharacterized protein n=1 Tax=Fimbriimonas ginsengisoli Gsoil 348 TaxID=661478 RepID=A0A068NJ18_FIMGI|nr:hypothetical protein [Fimbriimonas ginsengisoli]AIE83506.1 hypothetical protein OP10G_0138 [Fimbriimonas ginsengisoli Gsoil 348]
MKDSYYVIFNRRGIDRLLKTDRFDLKSGECVVRMEIEVPDSVFAKPVIPVTRVVIPAESINRTIEAETTLDGEVA